MIERDKEYYNQKISELYAVIENQEKIIRDLQEKEKKYKRQIKELKQELKEWSLIFDTFSQREYAHKYLEERRKEIPNLLAPDSDEIYREYYKLRDRIDKAIEYIEHYKPVALEDKILEILKGE